MNTSIIATSVASAFDSTQSTWASFKCFAGEVAESITKGATAAASFTADVISKIGAVMWWLVTLPVNIALTIIFYTMVYCFKESLEGALQDAEEELAFSSAVCVN